ncbi:MAG TPA: hypothetical protein EYG89_06345, partial [Bacteroidia bacterium]|nr:hypothetical protein [Bacteroidia bacterium]
MKKLITLWNYYDGFIGLFLILLDRIMFHGFKKYYYKRLFANYGNNIRWGKHGTRLTIPKNIRISSSDKIFIGDNCQFDEYVYLQVHHDGGYLKIGNNVRINSFSHIQTFSNITIEDFVLIAPFSHINSGNHGFEDIQKPVMYQEYTKAGEIVIGMGSWLGRSSQVLGNVHLGKNTVV